ncbi:MAG: amidohydrolase [Quisquiliibacterium sp.]
MYRDDDTALNVAQLTAFRHDLHMHPELKFEESRTSDKVASFLTALGLPIVRGMGTTGVVASVYGKGRSATNPGPAIGIRADMDALPVRELNQFAHASQHQGCMHACGHDGHTTMVLGAAALLAANREFDGTVHLIFQPGEEGGAGAREMIKDGLFTQFPCQAVFALHNWPALPQGQMGVRVGPMMGAALRFEIIVRGRGGHAATPHIAIDPIPIACAIVGQLQTLISRGTDPLDAAVLTIGRIESGTVENIIPAEAHVYGTCRWLSEQTGKYLTDGLKRISSHVAQAHFASAEVIIRPGYPTTDNHRDEAMFMAKVMREVAGEDQVSSEVLPSLTAEDFSYMLQQVPGAYGWIGNGADNKPGVSLHSAVYDFNDANLSLGPRFWDRLARRWFETMAKR